MDGYTLAADGNSWSNLGDVGAELLASSPVLANLPRLDLLHNQVSAVGMQCF